MLTNHLFVRMGTAVIVTGCVACAVISIQPRSAQTAAKGQESVVALSRINSPTFEMAGTPIEEGKPATYLSKEGDRLPAPSGMLLVTPEGLTAQAHSPAPGLAAIYQWVAKGPGDAALAKIEGRKSAEAQIKKTLN
jgi:hypothetical protein